MRALLLRWAPAFSRALMCHLRKGEDLREELEVGGGGFGALVEGCSCVWCPRLAALLCDCVSQPRMRSLVCCSAPVALARLATNPHTLTPHAPTHRACCCRTKLTRSCRRSTGQTMCCRWADMHFCGRDCKCNSGGVTVKT